MKDGRRTLAARLRQRERFRERPGLLKVGLFVPLILPVAFGFLLYTHLDSALTAVRGAERITGTITAMGAKVETYRDSDGTRRETTTYRIEVSFPGPRGERLTRPVQHNGAGDGDIVFAEDILDLERFREGAAVALLYHPELGHKVWFDDFKSLWLLPIVFAVAMMAAAFLTVGAIVALWPRPWLDFDALERAHRLGERYGRRPPPGR